MKSRQWVLRGAGGLMLEDVEISEPGDYEIMIKFHAASLNFRDLMIAEGTYMWKTTDRVVVGSDAAGEVIKMGPKATRFRVGQRVSPIFHLTHLYGSITLKDAVSQLGSLHDGVLRQFAVFNEQSCVEIPENLSYREAATLPCAAVTAWNALYGGPRSLKPGDTVLTQGTGGVSIFALQFAKLGGAEVISTTSDGAKAEKLKKMGVNHVLNYKDDPKWGQTVKGLSHRAKGADFVIEIGGPNTIPQSSQAVCVDGQIAVIGRLAGRNSEAQAAPIDTLATVRRIMVGSRQLHEEMNRAIEVHNIKPVIDDIFGKVVIDIE